MIARPTDTILRHIFAKHRKRFPADEHVRIHFVEPRESDGDIMRVQLDRMKGYGIDADYRHAIADVSTRPLFRHDRNTFIGALVEAIDGLVRLVLQPPLPTFRIRRDARRLTHKRDTPTRRFSSRLSRRA